MIHKEPHEAIESAIWSGSQEISNHSHHSYCMSQEKIGKKVMRKALRLFGQKKRNTIYFILHATSTSLFFLILYKFIKSAAPLGIGPTVQGSWHVSLPGKE